MDNTSYPLALTKKVEDLWPGDVVYVKLPGEKYPQWLRILDIATHSTYCHDSGTDIQFHDYALITFHDTNLSIVINYADPIKVMPPKFVAYLEREAPFRASLR